MKTPASPTPNPQTPQSPLPSPKPDSTPGGGKIPN
jgi:hypothetical protein